MTEKEKAKAYDEAIERAKKLYCKNNMCPCNNANGDDGTASLEDYYCLSEFC